MSTYFLSGGVVPKLVKVLVVMHMISMNSSEQKQEQAQQHNCVHHSTLEVSRFLLRTMTGVENCGGGGAPYGL